MDRIGEYHILMAHYAELDAHGTVLRVVVVHNDVSVDEAAGQVFIANLLGGEWIQCSYSGRIRKRYPGIGSTYNALKQIFIAPQPFPSWSLNLKHEWEPPTPSPEGLFRWNETTLSWVAE